MMGIVLQTLHEYGKDAILAVLGILGGGVISFFFYRRSLERGQISFACEYTRLIWSNIPAFSQITLSHGGQQIHDPRRVLFYVWNSGNTTIEGVKIATADPLRLRAGAVKIISAEVVKSSRDVICANAHLNAHGDVQINFDYLDASDGFVIEALYDVSKQGRPANTCPDLLGTIKGIRNAPINREIAFESRALKRFGQSTTLLLFLLASIILLGFQVHEIMDTHSWYLLVPKVLTAGLLSILSVGLIIALVFTLRSYRIPIKLKPPEEVNDFPRSYTGLVEKLEEDNQRMASENALLRTETSSRIATQA
jgi:hypothetical protein